MRILSFDTSENPLSVCLLADGKTVGLASGPAPGGQRQEAVTMLVPAISACLKEASWEKRSLECLVVGLGPGSFTGIRTGIVTARTLAQALDLPLIGVCRLQCLAWGTKRPAAVVLSGPPGFFFAAAYGEGGREALVQPAYMSYDEMIDSVGGIERWLVDAAARMPLADCGHRLEELPVYENIASIQAQVGWDRLSLTVAAGTSAQALRQEYSWKSVEPLYLRGPSVTVKKSHGHPHQANDSSGSR